MKEMWMQRKLQSTALICLLMALLFRGEVLAQQSHLLLIQIGGDLWTWSNAQPQVQRRTNWGYNQAPVLSPDGKLTAYKSTATLAVEKIKRSGMVAGGDLPGNIWLMDTVTGDSTRVADQPPNASFQQPGVSDLYVIRSTPTFSPDNQSLAWTEIIIDAITNPTMKARLVVYDINQKTSTPTVTDLPPQYGVPTALPLQWGNPGLAVWSAVGKTDSKGKFTVEDSLLIYDKAGGLRSRISVDGLYEYTWIKDADKDYLAVLARGPQNQPLDQTQWLLIDPISGRVFGMPGIPEMYSLTAPNGMTLLPVSMGTAPTWAIGMPDRSAVKLGTVDDVYAISRVLTISPDGQQIAYVKQGAVYVSGGGKTVKIAPADASAVAWGPTGWRVRRNFTAP
jgi:hypothetical protein